MDIREVLKNKTWRASFITISSLGLLYVVLRIFIFDQDPLIRLLKALYNFYLFLPEQFANATYTKYADGIIIQNHQLLFTANADYFNHYKGFIESWPDLLLYKSWSLLALGIVWFNYISVKKKIRYTFFFLLVHQFAVFAGLIFFGFIGPYFFLSRADSIFPPTLIGNMIIYCFISIFVGQNKKDLIESIKRLPIKLNINVRLINEALILLFAFFLLRSFIIPYFNFTSYVIFLLKTTAKVAAPLGYSGYIIGDQLIGLNGALALSKHCLGFMTMFVFFAMVFITRLNLQRRKTNLFLLIGLTVLFGLNLLRLLLVFIVAQGENGFYRASLHHEIYNIAIYIVIFILWILWFESINRFTSTRQRLSH